MKRNLPTIIGAVLAVTLLTALALFGGSNRAFGIVYVVDSASADDRHANVVKRVLMPAAILTCRSMRRAGLSYTDLDLEHVGVLLQISCYRPRK